MQSIKYVIVGLVLTLIAGAAYQAISEQSDRDVLPGRFVEVGANKYYLLCSGREEPTLLFESGRWGWHADWSVLWDALPQRQRKCTYDRLGLGWSSPNNSPTHSEVVVSELHELLNEAGFGDELIIVGHSLGGYYARRYAEAYPNRIAGLVLLDSTHEEAPRRMTYRPEDLSEIELCSAVAWSGALRVSGTMKMLVPKGSSEETASEILSVANRTRFCSGLLKAAEGIELELSNAEGPRSLGDIPLVVVMRGKAADEYEGLEGENRRLFEINEPKWQQMQREIADLSTRSKLMVAPESGHQIQTDSPQMVVEAIELVESWVNQ